MVHKPARQCLGKVKKASREESKRARWRAQQAGPRRLGPNPCTLSLIPPCRLPDTRGRQGSGALRLCCAVQQATVLRACLPACLPCPLLLTLPSLPSPTPAQQETFDFGDDSDGNATDASGSQDGSSNGSAGKGGTIASGVNRLKNQGTAISAYQPEPIASSGAVELACGFGWVDPYFQVSFVLLPGGMAGWSFKAHSPTTANTALQRVLEGSPAQACVASRRRRLTLQLLAHDCPAEQPFPSS